MQLFVINNESTWEQWQAGWNALTRSNPMACFEWLSSWWHHFGSQNRLHLVCVADRDQLVGFIPCYVHSTRTGKQLRFLGSGTVCSDYLTAVVNPERAAAVCEVLSGYFSDAAQNELQELDSLQFEGIEVGDRWHHHLEAIALQSNFSYRVQRLPSSWVLGLPTSWEELHQSQRGHGVFRKAKKCVNRLRSNELTLRQCESLTGFERAFNDLVRLHQARRNSVGDTGCFADPRFTAFLREAVARMIPCGMAGLSICQKADAVIGTQLLLYGTDTVFMYQSGVDPESMDVEPGHAIVLGSLLHSIERGFKHYDFLRGDEPYKAFWRAEPRSLCRVILAAPTLKAQTIETVHRQLSWLKSCCKEFSSSVLGAGVIGRS